MCSLYPTYCNSGFPHSEAKCHQTMNQYYRYNPNSYLCQKCMTVEEVPYETFYALHKDHLDSYKVTKKTMRTKVNKLMQEKKRDLQVTLFGDVISDDTLSQVPQSTPIKRTKIKRAERRDGESSKHLFLDRSRSAFRKPFNIKFKKPKEDFLTNIKAVEPKVYQHLKRPNKELQVETATALDELLEIMNEPPPTVKPTVAPTVVSSEETWEQCFGLKPANEIDLDAESPPMSDCDDFMPVMETETVVDEVSATHKVITVDTVVPDVVTVVDGLPVMDTTTAVDNISETVPQTQILELVEVLLRRAATNETGQVARNVVAAIDVLNTEERPKPHRVHKPTPGFEPTVADFPTTAKFGSYATEDLLLDLEWENPEVYVAQSRANEERRCWVHFKTLRKCLRKNEPAPNVLPPGFGRWLRNITKNVSL